MNDTIKIPSVNYHLWRPCNMRCEFCFATFQDIPSAILCTFRLRRSAIL